MITGLVTFSSLQSSLPTVFDAAIKGAILVVIAGVAAYLLRNRAAASRHAVWTAAVIGHLAIPLLAFVLPAWHRPLLPAAPWMAPSTQAPVSTSTVPAGAAATNAKPENASTSSISAKLNVPAATATSKSESQPSGARAQFSKAQIFAALWLAGALLVLLRLAIGTWQ